jgi:hypothetical protein
MTRSRWVWRRSTAIGAITALAVGASFAAAVSSSGSPAAVSQYGNKVTICHHTHSTKHPFVTITVSRNALPAHLRHGDTVGPCEGQTFKMCHKTKTGEKQTIKVRYRALKSHLRKGDKLGPCKTKAKGKGAKDQSGNKGKSKKPPKRK